MKVCFVYYRFPDDLALKEKWIKSTGISKVTSIQNCAVIVLLKMLLLILMATQSQDVYGQEQFIVYQWNKLNVSKTHLQQMKPKGMVKNSNVLVRLMLMWLLIACSTSNELSVNSIGVVNTDRTEYSKSPSFQVVDSCASMASNTSTVISKSCVQIPMIKSTDLLPEEVIEQTPCDK